MRSVHLSALTVLTLGALAPSAFAAQTFSFSNPFATTGSNYANSMFETINVPGGPAGTLQSFYAGQVRLRVVGANAGVYQANYRLLDSSGSPIFTLAVNPSGTFASTEGGTLEFLDAGTGASLLKYTFTTGGIGSNGGFGIAPSQGSSVTAVSGSLVAGPINTSTAKFSFGFPNVFTGLANTSHYTSDFTSSIEAVPEPASMGVLAIGAVALLRRRRRA